MKIIHLFWAGARELSSSWLLTSAPFESTAPHSKIQPIVVKRFRIFIACFSKVHWFFARSCPKFTDFYENSKEFQQSLRKRPKSLRFFIDSQINFLRFRRFILLNFPENCVVFSICVCHPENCFRKVRKNFK